MLEKKLTGIYKKSNRFYYGWIILGVSSLGYFFSGPGQTYFISIFINHYIADFGWSRSTVSGLYSVATLVAGLLLFLVGRLSDKYGQKRIILIVASLLGVACMWSSYITSLWMLSIAFFLGRLTGQGSMTLLPSIVIPQWFHKKRAFAFSIMSMGGVIGSALIPPFNAWLISVSSWNDAWRLWALLLWCFFIPVTAVFLYNKPQDLGLHPDNKIINAIDSASTVSIEESTDSWTLKEAMQTRSFWGMQYCQILLPMIGTGIVFHFFSILGERGIPSVSAAFVLSLLYMVSFPVTLLAGHFLDRLKTNHVIAFISLLELAALAVLLLTSSLQGMIMFGVIQGTAMGLQSVSNGIVWPNYYGLKHLGSVRGFAMTVMVIASAVGPLPFGLAYDAFNSYRIAFLIMMVFSFLGIFIGILSPKPVFLPKQ